MRHQRAAIIFFLGPLALCASAQTAAAERDQLRASAQAKVANLSLVLRPPATAAPGVAPSPQQREQAMSQIHSEIDAYIAQTVDPAHLDLNSLNQDLAAILRPHSVRAEYGDPPTAFGTDIAGTRFLLVAYVLYAGLHGSGGTSVAIRAYRAADGRFELADSTGDDMDGCELFVRELHAPLPNEAWLLAWGAVTGSSGPGAYIVRVYAFDGAKFRTIWRPDLLPGVTASVTLDGFNIRRVDLSRSLPPGWEYTEDHYVLEPGGPLLAFSSPDPH
jgi:hypothetical protein